MSIFPSPTLIYGLAQNSKVFVTSKNIQGVHKVRVHFKKFITLFTFTIEIICIKNWIEKNLYFLRF